MGRPGLLVKGRPTKASSIEARQHSGAGTRIEYTRALQGTGRGEGGNSKTVEERFAIIAAALLFFERRATSKCCSRGGHQHENAHESNNNGAHIWKL